MQYKILCELFNMKNKFTTEYFEAAKLYNEKFEFKYMDADDKREKMHICFNINDAFFKPLGAEITSILEVNKDLALELYVFVDSCSEINKENLRKTAEKYKCNIYLYIMDMSIYENFHINVTRFSRVTYIRIVMPWVLKEYTDRYLYLDADMIVIGSLKNFLNINMAGSSHAQVQPYYY